MGTLAPVLSAVIYYFCCRYLMPVPKMAGREVLAMLETMLMFFRDVVVGVIGCYVFERFLHRDSK